MRFLLCRFTNWSCRKSSSHPPSAQPPAPEPRGIRKVIPKVLPALTQHENIYTVPNILTFSRLIAAPFVGYAILHDAHAWALGLYVYAGVSDLLDGWIARQWKLQTVVGSIVDPMADKTLMTVLTVCLACKGALPGEIFLSFSPSIYTVVNQAHDTSLE